MPSTDKTSKLQASRIEHVRTMSPVMAAMVGEADEYLQVADSDAMWQELEGAES